MYTSGDKNTEVYKALALSEVRAADQPVFSSMAGLVPAIHALALQKKDVDARHKAGHDEARCNFRSTLRRFPP
jgi:hypothetical protein